jgi:cell wall-associated NlpC family hydrolase
MLKMSNLRAFSFSGRTTILLLTGWLLTAVAAAQTLPEVVEQVRQEFAPDARTVVFQITASESGVLSGQTSSPDAKRALLERLQRAGVPHTDQIRTLPDPADVGDRVHGVITISVGNLRSQPGHAAELATQALLGTPVRVLQTQGDWLRVQTPDAYIAWVDGGAVRRMNAAEFARWQESRKLIVLTMYGFGYRNPDAGGPTVSDLVVGNTLERLGERGNFYEVAYPDGRRAFVRKADAQPYETWLRSVRATEHSLVETAHRLTGLPYLWGGTSAKGVDCSGFTKTIYFLNGFVLPRDASQQVHAGELIDTATGFENLRPGDLLFFGSKRDDGTERVTHVGMWIGGDEFIHASSFVRVASVDPAKPNYDAFNRNRFLRAKRLLGTSLQGVRALR